MSSPFGRTARARRPFPQLFLARSVLVFLACCWPCVAHAADITLAWDPATDGITTGYIIQYGAASQSYSQQVDVGGVTSYTLHGLSDGTIYYFVVRAYDAAGHLSGPSNEVQATTPPAVPPPVTSLALTSSLPSPKVV